MTETAGSWTVNYIPEPGVRLTGKLVLTEDELRFRAMYDSSFKTIAKNIGLAVGSLAASGGAVGYLREDGAEAEIVLPRASISNADAAKQGMMKQIVVSTSDGQRFVFEYGVLSVKKIVAAING